MNKKFRIAQFGDIHLDNKNLEFVKPALDHFVELVEDMSPDLTIFDGDAFTRRGHLWATPIRVFRNACHRLADASSQGLLAVMGNHDQTFRTDTDDNLIGVLGGEGDGDQILTNNMSEIRIASRPGIFRYVTDHPDHKIAIAAIPTFDKYNLKLATDNIQTGDHDLTRTYYDRASNVEIAGLRPEDVVGVAVRGLLHEAREAVAGGPVVAVYHGSVAGAKLGNEQVIKAGIDVPVDRESFRGCDLGVFGHLHRPQEIHLENGPVLHYQGAIAPLTWVEKAVKPVALFHDLILDDDGKLVSIGTTRIPLKVFSHLLEATAQVTELTSVEVAVTDALEKLRPNLYNARTRITVHAKRSQLDAFRAQEARFLGTMKEKHELLEIPTLIKEITDDASIRVDMDKNVGIVEAVRSWWGLQAQPCDEEENKKYQAYGKRVMEIAEEIEGLVVDGDLDARFEFRPHALHVTNWTQFDNASLDFNALRGITAIVGKNTAGKSNLIRAMLFALYKHQAAGDVLSDLIRNGEDRAEVVLEFESKGERWRTTRRMKRGKGRAATAEFHFDRWDREGKKWVTAVEDESRDTQEVINDLVGPLDLFLATSFADQNSVDGLLDLRPAEFKDLLARVLHRNFAGRVKVARDRRATLEDGRREAEISRQVHEQVTSVESALTAEAAADATVRNNKAVLADLADPFEKIGALSGLEGALAGMDNDLAELDGIKKDLEGKIKPALDQARTFLDSAMGAEARADGIRFKIEELRTSDRDQVTAEAVDSAEAAVKVVSDALMTVLSDRSEIEDDGQKARNDLSNKLTTIRGRSASIGGEIRNLEVDLTRIIEGEGLLGDVPCHGKDDWVGSGVDEFRVDMGSCPLIAQAKDNVARKDSVISAISDRRIEVEDLDIQATETRKAIDAMDETREKNQVKHQEKVDAARAEVHRAETRLAEVRNMRNADLEVADEVATLKVNLADAMAKAEEIDNRREAVRLAEVAVAEATQKIGNQENLHSERMGILARLSDTRDEIEDLKKKRQDAETMVQISRDHLTRTQEALRSANEAAEKIAGLNLQVNSATVEIRALATYEDALGRDGVPFLLLERYAIPEIQARVNEYLEPTEFRVEIEPDRKDVSGKVKAGVFVTFRDSRGTHPVSAASGFQRNALGAALRNALADLHAQATGTRIWIAIQDEGFGAYDDANLAGAAETIRRVAERRESMLFVTHVPSVVEVADNVIEIQPIDGRSVVNLI